MTANDSKFYISYLNKLVDQYNNTYHHSIGEKLINADYTVLTEKIETNPKARKFKVNDRGRITNYSNIFSKGCTKHWSREIFTIDSAWKINPSTYEINELNGEKIIQHFHEKEFLLSRLWTSYYPEPGSHISNKVGLVSDLPNYTIKK